MRGRRKGGSGNSEEKKEGGGVEFEERLVGATCMLVHGVLGMRLLASLPM